MLNPIRMHKISLSILLQATLFFMVLHSNFGEEALGDQRQVLENLAYTGTSRPAEEIEAGLQICNEKGYHDISDDILFQLCVRYAFVETNCEKAVATLDKIVAMYPQGIRYETMSLPMPSLTITDETLKAYRLGTKYIRENGHSTADEATACVARMFLREYRFKECAQTLSCWLDRKGTYNNFSHDYSKTRQALELTGGENIPKVILNYVRSQPDKQALHMLALCYVKLGKKDKAREIYELAKKRFLESCPWAEEELKLLDEGNVKELEQKLENAKTNAVF